MPHHCGLYWFDWQFSADRLVGIWPEPRADTTLASIMCERVSVCERERVRESVCVQCVCVCVLACVRVCGVCV